MNQNEQFVRFLLECGALTFGDFTLKSGRKSPYMINAGKFDTGAALSRLGRFYARAIKEKMELGAIPKDITVLFGSAYKGIPLAAATSIALDAEYGVNTGYAFNRKEAKDHGEGGALVGKKLGAGDKALIIDDVMTAGTALRETIDLISVHAPEAKIAGSFIAVDRQERGKALGVSAVAEAQNELGIPIFSIIGIDEIVLALKTIASETAAPETKNYAPKDAQKFTMPTAKQLAALEAYIEENRPD